MLAVLALMGVSAAVGKRGGAMSASSGEQGAGPGKKQYIVYLKARDSFFVDATEEEKKTMFGHFLHLAELHKSGALLMGGRYMAEPIAVCVLEAANETEARRMVEADPGVKSGILKVELKEFMVPFLEGRVAPKM